MLPQKRPKRFLSPADRGFRMPRKESSVRFHVERILLCFLAWEQVSAEWKLGCGSCGL